VITSTFHTPGLEVAKIFGVLVSLTIGTLRNISGVPGWFKLNSALLEEFNVENVIVWGWQEVNEKHGEWLFGAGMFSVQNIGDFVAEVLYFGFDVFGSDRIVHIFQDHPIGAFLFQFKSMKLGTAVEKGFSNETVRFRCFGLDLDFVLRKGFDFIEVRGDLI
jgi:hypothetical protein